MQNPWKYAQTLDIHTNSWEIQTDRAPVFVLTWCTDKKQIYGLTGLQFLFVPCSWCCCCCCACAFSGRGNAYTFTIPAAAVAATAAEAVTAYFHLQAYRLRGPGQSARTKALLRLCCMLSAESCRLLCCICLSGLRLRSAQVAGSAGKC